MDTKARTRSAATLAVLAVLFVICVAWAWSSVTEPFPEAEDQPACLDQPVAAGDRITPGNVLVNVLNASSTEGLARETMDALVRKGFAEGTTGNNKAAETGDSGAAIWTDDADGPAAQLLKSYFGPGTDILEQPAAEPGITVVVGEGFPGTRDGKKGVESKVDGYVCSPPDQVAP